MAAKATKGICDDHQHPAVADFDFDTLNCCPLKVGSIQAIDKESVHRICSGQVVLTLATAVKELVENSIDAGATTVDIKLREYGSESIEVTDNGSGVEEKNFLGLTKKHYTSKLSDFSDLVSVETFGFRGEALSSLCALSRMAISTCHKSAAIGTRLEYDGNGQIVSKTPVPRQQGTTVTLQNIFYSLPVRHKEFQRNLKKEFSKMVQVLNAYCIISTGVRITGSNQANKGNRSVVLSTNGNSSVKENIANIFGSKQLQGLVPFEQSLPSENDCSDFGIQYNVGHADLFSIEGFVSKCDHGQGRSSTDRQFLFINKRPCDASKILKVINEVYHSYNRHQYPFVVLLISLAKDSVDVNVTPDKRQIFLEGEKFLLATIKTSLVKMFEPTTSVLRLNLIPHESGFPKLNAVTVSSPAAVDLQSSSSAHRLSPDSLKGQSQNNIKDGAMSSLARLKRSFSSAFDRTDTTDSLSPKKKRNYSTPARFSPDKGSITRFLTSYSASPGKRENKDGSLPVSSKPLVCDLEPSEPAIKETVYALFAETVSGIDSNPKKLDSCSAENTCMHKACAETEFGEVTVDVESQRNLVTLSPSASLPQERDLDLADAQEGNFPGNHHEHFQSVHRAVGAGFIDLTVDEEDSRQEPLKVVNCLSEKNSSKTEVLESDHFISNAYFRDKMKENCTLHRKMTSGEIKDKGSSSGTLSVTITQLDMEEQHQRPKLELNFSLQLLQKCVTSAKNLRENNFARSFRAKICPTDNSSAEEELKREISKDMFAKMDVLGQFNLGFIIVRSGDDLFIVDQHATDEKYNFEMLQQHTVLQTQQLIHPQGLELTASNEVTLLDNLHIFRKNGFDFIIDETALPTQRVKLKSAPVSKNWSFGKDDIEELVFMLTDSPGVMCRPSRVRMMFASRACRKSVMIGTHLNKNEMKRLLCHMGEIEQPWNCPHGRPTIRHLINLNMLPQ